MSYIRRCGLVVALMVAVLTDARAQQSDTFSLGDRPSPPTMLQPSSAAAAQITDQPDQGASGQAASDQETADTRRVDQKSNVATRLTDHTANADGIDTTFQTITDSFSPVEQPLTGIQGTPVCQLGDDCGGPICEYAECCPQRGGFYAGMGIVFAKPHFKESFQYSQIDLQTGQQTLFPFEYDFETTPRAWLGFRTPSGLGVMSRYWQFDQSGQQSFDVSDGFNIYGAHAVTIIFPANIFADFPGESLTTENSLLTQILELYGTADFQFQGIEATGGFGLRYVQLAQEVAARVADAAGTPQGLLYWVREFEGLGPSITLDARRRLGRTPLSAVVSGGGAFLFGNKTINRTVFGDQSPQPAAPFLSLLQADEVVGLGELSVGLEAARQFRNGSEFVIRGTYEGSLWAEAGAPTLGFLGFQGFGVTAEFRR